MLEAHISFETTIPQDIYSSLQAQGLFREKLAEQTRHLLAMHFFQDRQLSLGQAARLADMNLWEFTEFLARHNVPVIDFNDEELADEFVAVEQMTHALQSE